MMSRGYVYLLLLDRVGPVGGSVEHLEGKDGENVVIIMRFVCGSHHKDCVILTPMTSLELCTDCMSGFMWSDKPSSFYNYYIKPQITASCGTFTFWRENETEGQDFILGAGGPILT
jgi:hypothetical protein